MISESETFLQLSAEMPGASLRKPCWNVASLLLPLSGYALVWFQVQHAYATRNASIGVLLMALVAVVGIGLAGLVCAIVAMVRAERLLALTVFGFIGNLTPLLAILGYILEMIH